MGQRVDVFGLVDVAHQVETAISKLAAAGLVLDETRVGLARPPGPLLRDPCRPGRRHRRLFGDFPPEDLATAGRVLAIVTARANAELADPELS